MRTAVLASLAAVVALGAAEPKAPADPGTGLMWSRPVNEQAITVTATRSGARLAEAQADVTAIAERLDALRTITPHVRWQSIRWDDGRLQVRALADTAVFGNVALRAVRKLFPGATTAGSHVQQMQGIAEGVPWRWRVQVLVTKPAPKPAP